MNIEMIPDGIDPDIDVRLTAMILGEASDFEAAQLRELMGQRPELVAWYQQLEVLHSGLNQWAQLEQSLHGLMKEEKVSEASAWILSPEKRANVLAILGQGEVEKPVKVMRLPIWQKITSYRPKRRGLWIAVSVVASLVIVCNALLLRTSRTRSVAFSTKAPARIEAYDSEGAALPSSSAPSGFAGGGLRESAVVSRDSESDNANAFYSESNQAVDAPKQTDETRFDFTEGLDAIPQTPAPGGGGGLFGGIAAGSASPPAPTGARAPSVASGESAADHFFGLAAPPTDKAGEALLGELSDNKLAENEELKQQAEFQITDMAREQASRRSSEDSIALSTEERLGRFGRTESNQPSDSKNSPETLGYLGDEAKPKSAVAPKSPVDVAALDLLESLAEEKTKNSSATDPFSKNAPVAKPSSAAAAKEELGSAPAKGKVADDFDAIAGRGLDGVGEADRMSGMGGMGGAGMGGMGVSGGRGRVAQNSVGKPESPRLLLEDEMRSDGGKRSEKQAKKDLAVESQNPQDNMARWYLDIGREKKRLEGSFADSTTAGKELTLGRRLQQTQPVSGLNETFTETERFSTFSLHVSDVSFKLALDSLAKGQWPEASKIRLEEFVNAFDYQDPLPSEQEKVACRVEQAIHPFLMQRNLLRVAMRTSATGRNSTTPLRLTLLLDNSGSMQRADRAETVRRAFETLSLQLNEADQVTLITFANEPKLRAERVKGNEIQNFVNILENSPVEGGTNMEAALRLALEKSLESRTQGAQSRVILMTDGAVNLGDANPSNLSSWVLKMRDQGIAFDAAGISAQDLNDEVLETLTRQGDGRYYLLDNAEQVDAGFAQQIAGALRPSAKNVKVQVEFNPQRVRSYKLLGFEKHILNKEDFRNDKVDAAELAAAEAGVALYHYEVSPDGVGDVGSVSVRFQDLATGLMVEKRWPIAYEATTSRLDQANSSMKLAASAVLFAAHLKGDTLGDNVDLKYVAEVLGSLESSYSRLNRVQQLQQMVESARQIAGANAGSR